MVFILALFALQTGVPLLLTDEVVVVPPSQLRAVEVSLRQRPAVVECGFRVGGEHPGVRVALMTKDDADRFQRGQAHNIIASTAYQHEGNLKAAVEQPGDYVIVLDNRLDGHRAAHVRLKVNLTFASEQAPNVRYVPRERQALSIAAGLLFFFTAVLIGGWKIHGAITARNAAGPPRSY
jgi:hypothetical protein